MFLLGTSRPNGNTRLLVDLFNKDRKAPVIDLSEFKIAPYDYEYRDSGDDFPKLVDMLLQHETIVFATPVYWYSMSSQLKTFIDRFSDLVRIDKKSGRALAGRRTFLAATGTDNDLPPGYEEPFRLTAAYLDMDYCGSFYSCIRKDLTIESETLNRAPEFAESIFYSAAPF